MLSLPVAIPSSPWSPSPSPGSFLGVTMGVQGLPRVGTSARTWDTSVTRGTILGERKVVHVQERLSPLITSWLADQELCVGVPKQKEDCLRGTALRERPWTSGSQCLQSPKWDARGGSRAAWTGLKIPGMRLATTALPSPAGTDLGRSGKHFIPVLGSGAPRRTGEARLKSS